MEVEQIWSNLGMSDLERTTRFYKELGFKPNGSSAELTSFFAGENNFVIHFFLKDVLKSNVKMEIADLGNGERNYIYAFP